MAESQRQYDTRIVDAVRAIVLKHTAPTRIYLFGSRITGEAKPESDYDFAFDALRARLHKTLSPPRADNVQGDEMTAVSPAPTFPRNPWSSR